MAQRQWSATSATCFYEADPRWTVWSGGNWSEDVEERYRRIQAEQEAKNIGAVIGLVAGVAMVLTQDEQSSTEQQWTEDQQAEQTQQQTM
jgi:hypothetical protein